MVHKTMEMYNHLRSPIFCIFLVSACVPSQRAGREEPSTQPEPSQLSEEASLSSDGDMEESLDATSKNGTLTDAAILPKGALVHKIAIGNDGGRLHVERIDGKIGFRLVAAPSKAVAVEPISWFEGASKIGFFWGKGCQKALPGREIILGLWDGKVRRCKNSPQDMAILSKQSVRRGCVIDSAQEGVYSFRIWLCGNYGEEIAAPSFAIPGIFSKQNN